MKFKIVLSIAVAFNLLLTFGVATMLDDEIKFNTATNSIVKESLFMVGEEIDSINVSLTKAVDYNKSAFTSIRNLNEEINELNNITHYLQQDNTRLSYDLENLHNLLLDNKTIYEEQLQRITDNLILIEDQTEKQIEQEDTATGGFGVLTGQHVLPIYNEEEEQDLLNKSCPKIDRSVNLGNYISNITFNRDVKVVLNYNITRGVVENVRVIEGRATSKLLSVLTNYLQDAIPQDKHSDTVAINCMLPIKIEV